MQEGILTRKEVRRGSEPWRAPVMTRLSSVVTAVLTSCNREGGASLSLNAALLGLPVAEGGVSEDDFRTDS